LCFDASRIGKVDAIFHCAARLPSAEAEEGPSFILDNGGATLKLIEASAQFGIERFIYLSSISVIGAPVSLPIAEDHPLAPKTPYALGKATGELACCVARDMGIKATALRLSSPYGPGMNQQTVLPLFVGRARRGETLMWHGTGSRSQDFIHVDDVVDACLLAAGATEQGVFCLGSGIATSMKLLAQSIVSLIPNTIAEPSGKPDEQEGLSWQLDISKIAQSLNFQPKVSLIDGLQDYLSAGETSLPAWMM
jgi:UDP-glucose 4-epimerase